MDEDRQALNEKILAGGYLKPHSLSCDLLDLLGGMIQATPANRVSLAAIK
jgi:hypothetical protein